MRPKPGVPRVLHELKLVLKRHPMRPHGTDNRDDHERYHKIGEAEIQRWVNELEGVKQ